MKTLFLIRHAKSDWSDDSVKDHDRTLNSRGFRVAPKMAMFLKESEISFDKIFSSSAIRAKTTAEFIAERINDENILEEMPELYMATSRQLLNIVNQLDDSFEKVALVGHNPDFTYFAEYLTNEAIGHLPTCGIVQIEFDLDSWTQVSQNLGKLKNLFIPEELGF